MCCLNFTKNVIPFAITFIIGLLFAGIFFNATNSDSLHIHRLETFEKKVEYKPTSCFPTSEMQIENHDNDVLEMVPAVPLPPPPPPAPTVVMPNDIEMENNFDIWVSEPSVHYQHH